MRIGIVNDVFIAVEAMRRVVTTASGHQVAWIARDGLQAVARCAEDRPDLILMDLIMPNMDGIEATRQIMARTPCAIVVVTANVEDNASQVFEAMGAGALDAVNTPALSEPGNFEGAKALLAKIETIGKLIGPSRKSTDVVGATGAGPRDARQSQLVAIGASAGGPAALVQVLAALPADFPAAVVIVQHVDEQFAPGLAGWLGTHARLRVRLAEEGDHLRAGTVFLAATKHHLVLREGSGAPQLTADPSPLSPVLGYTPHPVNCSYQPSVDVFFKSVERLWQGQVVGVLLTGMGRDGAEGLKALRERGHHTIAQDQPTSAVYGMPKAALELDAATEILALDKIGPRLTNIVMKSEREEPGAKCQVSSPETSRLPPGTSRS